MHVSVQKEQAATKCVRSGTGTTENVRQWIGIHSAHVKDLSLIHI